jgi:hypothetical protein
MSYSSRRLASLSALALALAVALPAQSLSTARRAVPATPTARSPEGDCGPLSATQNTSQTPASLTSIACVTQDGNDFHFDTSWWRAFRLADYGIEGDFTVCALEMAIEVADSGSGAGQPMTVNLWLNEETCPFPGGARTLIGTASVTVTDQSLTTLTIPVSGTARALSELAVEIAVPNGVPQSDVFFAGSNSAGQTAPTYISSTECGLPQPIDLAAIGFPDSHVIMRVIGDQGPLGPKAIDVDAAGNSVIEVGEQASVAPSWKNLTASSSAVTGTKLNLVTPPPLNGTILDGAANYGTISAGATANCATATGDCYTLQFSGTGFGHRDATVDETVVQNLTAPAGPPPPTRTRVMHIGGSFADVPTTHIFYRFIETLLHNQVTGGCATANSYCPGDTTLRKQMAVFLLKALLGPCYVPPPAAGVFSDVPPADPFAPWIEDLAGRGITGGCGTGIYCPNDAVKRKQMAVFLLKTLLGSAYTPPAATGIFDDVPADGFRAWIEDLYNRGITGGCAGGPPPAPISYCPENPVTRGQMATFLTKTFGLLLYRP